jgi:hypothetical protein
MEESQSTKDYRQQLLNEGWREDSREFESLMALHKYLEETPQEVLEKEWAEIEKMDHSGPTVEEYFQGINPQYQYQKGYSDGAKSFKDKVIAKLKEGESDYDISPHYSMYDFIDLMEKIYNEE